MAHWRKQQPSSQFNSFVVWLVGTSVVLAALVFISRHVYIEAWPRRLRGITVGRWHEKETKRFNERSMRRAIVASVVIVGLLYWWLAASIPPHAAWH